MGQAYYYFVSTLPMLIFGYKSHISQEEFLNSCERLLSVEDYSLLMKLLEGREEHSSKDDTLNKVIRFNQSFHNLIAAFRAQRAGLDANEYVHGERYDNPFLVELLQRASKETNLLTAEKLLAEAKWNFLEDIVVGHHHDLAFLCVYGLKLKISERLTEIQSPQGGKIFEKYEMFQFTGENYMTLPEHRSAK